MVLDSVVAAVDQAHVQRDQLAVERRQLTGRVERLEAAGAQAFLVGEALMREEDIGAALRRLRRSA